MPELRDTDGRVVQEATTLGFECVEFWRWCSAELERLAAERDEPELSELLPPPMPWQVFFLVHALELLDGVDQLFRFVYVILLVARQNGKTTLMAALILWRLFQDDAREVIGSAQTLDVAEETWERVVAVAEAVPELDNEVKRASYGSGKRVLTLDNKAVYKPVPSNRGGGRSKAGDLVFMDELREHQSWEAWAAVTKTTMAKPRCQVYGVSNAGDSTSVVLAGLRTTAHMSLGNPDKLGKTPGLPEDPAAEAEVPVLDENAIGIFEWSMPPGMSVHNTDGWCMANPALGHTITERNIGAAIASDPEWIVRTEVFCQWWAGALTGGTFPPQAWANCLDPSSEIPVGNHVVAVVDVSANGSTTTITAVGKRSDGLAHVEVVESRPGSDWLRPWFEKRAGDFVAITGQANGAPVSPLMDDLTSSPIVGHLVVPWGGPELAKASVACYNSVRDGLVRHVGQPLLDVAVAVVVIKPTGDGSYLFDRVKSPADVAPVIGMAGGLWLLAQNPEPQRASAYETEGLMIA